MSNKTIETYITAWVMNPNKSSRYAVSDFYGRENKVYRMWAETGTLYSYRLPIATFCRGAFYVLDVNSTPTTNKYIRELLSVTRREQHPTYLVHHLPDPNPHYPSVDLDAIHKRNAELYLGQMSHCLEKISAPRIRLVSRAGYWAKALHEYVLLRQYAVRHDLQDYLQLPPPKPMDYFDAATVARLGLEGIPLLDMHHYKMLHPELFEGTNTLVEEK
jgi:hypothetical protein